MQQLLIEVKVMLVALTTVNVVMDVPPTVTDVAPRKLVPVIVTVSPYAADVVPNVETNEVMVGTSAVHFAKRVASEAVLYVPVPAA